VNLPKQWSIKPETVTIENPAFSYRSEVRYAEQKLELTYDYQGLSGEVAPTALSRYLSDRRHFFDDLSYELKPNADEKVSQRVAVEPIPFVVIALSVWFGMWFGRRWVYRPTQHSGNLACVEPSRGLPGMRIEFELKFRDYLSYNLIHQFLSMPVQILFVGVTALIAHGLEVHGLSAVALAFVLFYVGLWASQAVFVVAYLCFGTYRSLLTKHVVEIQEDAFYDETAFGRSHHYWRGISKAVRRPGFTAVYINASAAHIIPNRAFSSDEQRRLFLLTLREKIGLTDS
jgi:hypothetical protein